MARVRITASVAGVAFSFMPGQVVDLDPKLAQDLVQAGHAQDLEAGPGPDPERDLSSLGYDELLAMARQRDPEFRGRPKKSDLLSLLQSAQDEV